MTPQIGDLYYRYSNAGTFIHREELRVTKVTRAGVWLDDYGFKKFVLNGVGRRYAYPTDALARESFHIRKIRQIQHLKNQLETTEKVLARIDEFHNIAKEPDGPGMFVFEAFPVAAQ